MAAELPIEIPKADEVNSNPALELNWNLSLKELNIELLRIVKNGKFFLITNPSFFEQINEPQVGEYLNLNELRLNQVPKLKNDDDSQKETLEMVNNLNEKIKIKIPTKPQGFTWKKLYEAKMINKDEVPS